MSVFWKGLGVWYCHKLGVFSDGQGIQMGNKVFNDFLSVWRVEGIVLEKDLKMLVMFMVGRTALQAVSPSGIHIKGEVGLAGCGHEHGSCTISLELLGSGVLVFWLKLGRCGGRC